MTYQYTTYMLDPSNGLNFVFGTLVTLLVFSMCIAANAHATIKSASLYVFGAILAGIATVTIMWRDPYPNEQVIATMVENDDAMYKSGKHSYVKGASVTYKLPDGGLVTYRADGGIAWYPQIILYKNPSRR